MLGVAAMDETSPTPGSPPAQDPGSGKVWEWNCDAQGSVRNCLGPNNCMDQPRTGYGMGDTRAEAAEMALTACRGQTGGGPCVLFCKQR